MYKQSEQGGGALVSRRAGFSLIEILVVVLILAILISIVVPALIATQPQRNLAAASEKFANDINYCRSKAEATGNTVFMAFECEADDTDVEGYYDNTNTIVTAPTRNGQAYINPGNPGIRRSANAYYVVEERGRVKADGSDYTYLDWLNDYDAWNAGNGDYPVEPLFPFSTEDTATSGVLPDPSLGSFNAVAAPLVAFPQHMITGDATTDYFDRHIANKGLDGGDWRAGDPGDQIYKTFCVADEAEILSYDQNINDPAADFYPPNDPNGLRTYDPTPGGMNGGNAGSSGDHPRLQEQVVDYVLLKRETLPEHVYFMNPWDNFFVTGWRSGPVYTYQDMQFLQYLWAFKPSGEVSLRQWGYEPEPFPDGSYDSMVHGQTVEIGDNTPVVRMMWMTLDEAIDFNADRINTTVKKANQSTSGRIFALWPLNGKYVVEDYTPNDVGRVIDPNDPLIQLDNPGVPVTTGNSASIQREVAYSQNFLVEP